MATDSIYVKKTAFCKLEGSGPTSLMRCTQKGGGGVGGGGGGGGRGSEMVPWLLEMSFFLLCLSGSTPGCHFFLDP